MKTITVVALLAPILGAICFQRCASASNLVANGGFESGYYDEWSLITGGIGNDLLITNNSHSELQAASFAATRHIDDSIYQLLPTQPGSFYEIKFWLANESVGDQDNHFQVLWDNAPILTLTNATFFNYTEYTFTELATGTTTEIMFSGANKPAATYLDDVSVTPTIPEPSTLVLFILGAVSVPCVLRRRNK